MGIADQGDPENAASLHNQIHVLVALIIYDV
jgi:hypothetical protein